MSCRMSGDRRWCGTGMVAAVRARQYRRGIAVDRGSGVAQRDLVRLRDAVGFDSSQSFTQPLTGLPQELERVGGPACRGSPIQVSAVLLDQVRLQRRGDFVSRLQSVVDDPVTCGVVNHGRSIPAAGSAQTMDHTPKATWPGR